MMLYENVTVQCLWKRKDDPEFDHHGCRVVIEDTGIAEIIDPEQQVIIVTHIRNLVIISGLKFVDPDPGNGTGEINPITIGNYQYCDICGQLIHNDIWDTHIVECLSAL